MDDMTRLATVSAVVSDIDGVLLVNGQIVSGVAELAAQKPLALVSNNSTHTANELCEMFYNAGVQVSPEQFFLAGQAAVKKLACDLHEKNNVDKNNCKVLALATPSIHRLMLQEGLEPVLPCQWQEAQAVLICRDTTLTYEKLESAANAALAGLPVYCANPDLTHPAEEGLHLETGAILALLQAAVPTMSPIMLGKPSPELLLDAVRYLNVDVQDAVFLGDNLMTDAPCAKAAGMPFVHVDALRGPSLADLGKAWLTN